MARSFVTVVDEVTDLSVSGWILFVATLTLAFVPWLLVLSFFPVVLCVAYYAGMMIQWAIESSFSIFSRR